MRTKKITNIKETRGMRRDTKLRQKRKERIKNKATAHRKRSNAKKTADT